jgi:CDP-glucose 4,6-dehydratase
MENLGLKYSMVSADFWRGKKVLVTGHTGFKGSWLCLWLRDMGADVVGLSLVPGTQPSLFIEAGIEHGMTSYIGDIRDFPFVRSVFQKSGPEIVIHMAAQPLVRYSYQYPVDTYSTNVMGTIHVLEAIRQCGTAKAVVNITTDKCYENREWWWGYREDEPMGGHDPYSSSKGCAELVTSAYRRSYFQEAGIAVASARAGNVIGGGDWAQDRLIPDIMRSFEKNEVVVVRNPDAVRPWQYVLEPLSGYLVLAEHLYKHGQEFAEGWNFGPSDEDAKSVRWIVEYLVRKWGRGSSWTLDKGEHPHEAKYLKLDISKARNCLGWSPRWNLSTALDKTLEWQQVWLEKGDIGAMMSSQIEAYQKTQ